MPRMPAVPALHSTSFSSSVPPARSPRAVLLHSTSFSSSVPPRLGRVCSAHLHSTSSTSSVPPSRPRRSRSSAHSPALHFLLVARSTSPSRGSPVLHSTSSTSSVPPRNVRAAAVDGALCTPLPSRRPLRRRSAGSSCTPLLVVRSALPTHPRGSTPLCEHPGCQRPQLLPVAAPLAGTRANGQGVGSVRGSLLYSRYGQCSWPTVTCPFAGVPDRARLSCSCSLHSFRGSCSAPPASAPP
jgi:hypothetical protein